LRFSGDGFHFIIPYIKLGLDERKSFDPSVEDNIYNLYKRIALRLKEEYSELIDESVYDGRRVAKLPYSLALYPHGSYVCLPFNTDDEFDEFDVNKMTPDYWIENIGYRRENLFNGHGNIRRLLEFLEVK
jgi:hypothetical protein